MRLEVAPGELDGLAHGLSGLIGDLEHAGDIGSIRSDAAENAELQAAIDGLVARWTRDLHDVQTKLRELTKGLDGASAEYDRMERAIAQEITIDQPSVGGVPHEVEA